MSPGLPNRVRIEQTQLELEHLKNEFKAWVADRRKRDRLQQFDTALTNLETEILGAVRRLHTELSGVAAAGPTGDVYGACRKLDRNAVLVRRVWAFFRTKFEQREDPLLGPVLAAADEVVWSCYAEALQNAGGARQPAPLPYVEPFYSPQAVPRADPPSDLRGDSPLLQEYMRKLPIPVVSLPPACVRAPWWLIYLGHEVGHHVQYDLLPDWKLVGDFGKLLGVVFAGDDDTAQRWESWGREIFADIFSAAVMGPPAVWAMAALELAGERDLLVPRAGKAAYPPALVRLELLACVADKLGVDGRAQLLAFDLDPAKVAGGPALVEQGRGDLRAAARADLERVPKVVQALADHPGPGGLKWFKTVAAWDANAFADGGAVELWATALRQEKAPAPDETLRGARLVTSAAAAAWAQVTALDPAAEREAERARLARNALDTIAASREAGTRSGNAAPAADEDGRESLAELLLKDGPDLWGDSP